MGRRRPICYSYTVVGAGFDFPLDMLRCDRAWPRFESNLPRVNRLSLPAGVEERVQLVGMSYPHVGRWQSFGWNVVDIEPWDEPYSAVPAPKVRIDRAIALIRESDGIRPSRRILNQLLEILRGVR